jgi:hypothetical protein
MHTRSFFPAHFALAAATPSRAQGFVSPFIGYDFGRNSGCPQISNCEDKRTNFGVAIGAMGKLLGFEEKLADAKNFFGSVGTQSSSVITVMSNVMIVPAVGPVHPYLLGGLGLMKTHVDFTTSGTSTRPSRSRFRSPALPRRTRSRRSAAPAPRSSWRSEPRTTFGIRIATERTDPVYCRQFRLQP